MRSPPPNSTPLAVRKLVEQLGSKDFATRERASRELSQLEEASEALREAVKNNDQEIRRRAQTAIDVINARAEDKALKAFVKWMITKDFKSNDPHDPLVVRNKVIVGTDQGQLCAYRCNDGNGSWVHEHGTRIYHRPSSDGQRIYFSSAKGLTAVMVEGGAEVVEVRFCLAAMGQPLLFPTKKWLLLAAMTACFMPSTPRLASKCGLPTLSRTPHPTRQTFPVSGHA